MFTGIVEATGLVESIEKKGTNVSFWLSCPFTQELKLDQSVAHNGVCLTVDQIEESSSKYRVTAVEETLKKTNLGAIQVKDFVNLERCMRLTDRLDGHLVQGHVDTTATCTHVETLEGSWLCKFAFHSPNKGLVEKGSICINGVSLTCFNVTDDGFTVTIIPYTYEHTNFQYLKAQQLVNIEFDIIGKYVARLMPTS